jgi:hypothetical protein
MGGLGGGVAGRRGFYLGIEQYERKNLVIWHEVSFLSSVTVASSNHRTL